MLANKLMSALTGGTEDKLYVDDVFSTYLYTGNGSTQTINNGIDLAGNDGMVWTKTRNTTFLHSIFDTARGATKRLLTSLTNGEMTDGGGITAFTSSGFTVAASNSVNNTNSPMVSWTFRRAPKFFDVVTYTGDGTTNKSLPHALGVLPGFVIVKRTDVVSNWLVMAYGHLAGANYGYSKMVLNSTVARESTSVLPSYYISSSQINFGALANLNFFLPECNTSGGTYVAYLFAHDPSADGIIQCGSFTTDAGGNATVNLGWEPQYLMAKWADGSSSWLIIDSMRGWPNGGRAAYLMADNSSAESSDSALGSQTATGFTFNASASQTYIYLAIRRPNKPPTSGTEVYNARATTSAQSSTSDIGFAADAIFSKRRTGTTLSQVADRLRGIPVTTQQTVPTLNMESTAAESSVANIFAWGANDVGQLSAYQWMNYLMWNTSSDGGVGYALKRAPGFFDVVCYTGTGVARTVPHNLGVAPELMIVKRRNSSNSSWNVFAKPLGSGSRLQLQLNDGSSMGNYWNSTDPTSTVFTVGTIGVNTSADAYVAYLFATLLGISKVGSYTGNGGTQTIDCGFTAGARFILIKRTDNTGDWYVWDTARGIVAANDPHLSLNTTAAEVTSDDSVDPHASGFIVNQVAATNINVSGGQYIFLAIA